MKKETDEILEFVKKFADESHGTQVRKYTGERYIVHPVRVMELVRQFQDDVAVLSAALLHDVIEDTHVGAAEITRALLNVMEPHDAERTVALVVELTDVFIKKDYPRMNRRSRKENEANRLSEVSPDAQTIKYADIIDNVTDIVQQDTDFAKVFVSEAKRMLSVMTSGHPTLRDKALVLVEESLRNFRKTAESYQRSSLR